MAVMLKGFNMPGRNPVEPVERSTGTEGANARRALRKSLRMRENRQWRREAEAEIREMYDYDADDAAYDREIEDLEPIYASLDWQEVWGAAR